MVLITGATGFVGRHLVPVLLSAEKQVRCLVRPTSDTTALKALPLQLVVGDVCEPATLRTAMEGVDSVVHLVAVIRERPRRGITFQRVNEQGTRNVAEAAKAAAVRHFVHVSAIGVRDDPRYSYWYSKWQAEQAVVQSGLPFTILRFSLIFGPGDEFITELARLVRRTPIVPIIGDGKTRFQHIWVQDVARCVARCLDDATKRGRTLELGGPERLTYTQTVDLIAKVLGRRRFKLHVPIPVMLPLVRVMERVLPRPPITSVQLRMVPFDSIAESDAVSRHFGFSPKLLAEGIDYIRLC